MGSKQSKSPDGPPQMQFSADEVKQLFEAQRQEYERKSQREQDLIIENVAVALRSRNEDVIVAQRKLQEEAACLAAQRKEQEEAFLAVQKKLQEEAAYLEAQRKLQKAIFINVHRKYKEEADKEAAQRKLGDAAAKRKLEEEAAKRKLKEEAAKRKLEEEAAKRKLEEEAAKRKLEEEAAKRKLEEEAAKRKLEEEAAKRKLEEEAAKRKLEEEAAKRKLEEEAAKRKLEEEAAKRKLEEEAAKRKLEDEAAKRKIQAEAFQRKLLKEAAQRKLVEEAAKSKLEEEAAKRKLEEEAAKRKLEEEAAKRKLEEEAAKRKLEEEAAKRKLEDEAAKRKIQAEAFQRKLLKEAAQRKHVEEAAKRKREEEISKKVQEAPATRSWSKPSTARVSRYCNTRFKCDEGHGSYKNYWRTRQDCGYCSSTISGRRSYHTKNDPQTKVPCPNTHGGCNLLIRIADMEKHVKECPFKTQDCPHGAVFRTCNWQGNINCLSSHFDEMHPNCVVTEMGSELCIKNIHRNQRYVCLIEKGDYFVFHLRVSEMDRKIYMVVQLIGTKQTAMECLYEIHVYNKSESRREYMYTDNCCSTIDNMDDVFKREECAVLPMRYANTFVNNGALTLKYFITRIDEKRTDFGSYRRSNAYVKPPKKSVLGK